MDLESVKIKVILDGKEAQIGLNKFNKLVGNIGKSTKVADKSFKTLGSTLKKAGLVGQALGIGAVALTMKSFADNAHRAADEIRQLSFLSARTGVSIQSLTKTGTALESMGIKATTYQQAIDSLSSGVARLSLGDAGTLSTLASMGVMTHRNGEQLSGKEIFAGVANYAKRMANLGENSKKTARQQLMSLNFAPELIEKMWGGADEFFRKIEEQSQKVGSLSEKEIEKSQRWKEMSDELSTAFDVTSSKLFFLASGPLTDFGNVLTRVVKGVGDVATDVGEDDGLSRVASGATNFFLGTKVMPWVNTAVHKVLSPLMESKSLLGSGARGLGALTETATGLASKGFAALNLYSGSNMAGEGMYDFWKGNDPASKWFYDNISARIGRAYILARDNIVDAYENPKYLDTILSDEEYYNELKNMEKFLREKAKNSIDESAVIPPSVGENWDRGTKIDGGINIDVKQEFHGNTEPEEVKSATEQAIDISLKDVNLM